MAHDNLRCDTLDGKVRLHANHRDALLLQYPELDDETLADTLDGLTDLNEILAAFIRSALDDQALADALSTRLGQMKTRLDRLRRRAKTKRSHVMNAMTKAELKRLIDHDFTVSLRTGGPTLEILQPDRIPEDYWKPQPPKLDRQRLIHDLKHGLSITGAQLGPRTPHLSVKVI